jgi:hypothetical protein
LKKIVAGILCTLVLVQGSRPIPLSVEQIEDVLNCLSGSSQKVIVVNTALLSEFTTSTTLQLINFVLGERLINVKRLLPLDYSSCIAQYPVQIVLQLVLAVAAGCCYRTKSLVPKDNDELEKLAVFDSLTCIQHKARQILTSS